MIGPSVFPYLTPCFACTEARVLETLRDHALYTGYRSALAESKVYGPQTLIMDPMQATSLSLAGWEITNIMTVGSAFTAGKLLTIYAPTLEFAFHELTRFPGCPVCSTRSGLDQQLYSDLRAYLSSRSQLGEREAR
jgi:bacteriocin biosynthesis cyclodehydratase domain-containing protein